MEQQHTDPTKSFQVKEVTRQGHELHLSCRVPEDLMYFKGHFEGTPVVAGVVQLKWIDEAIARYFGHALKISGMEAVKFHQLLFPGSCFDMRITHQPAKNKWVYNITTQRGKVASGRLLEQPEAAS